MRGALSETNVVADLCRKSFFDFVREFWSVYIAEEPVWNWHIKYICDRFQEAAERVMANQEKLYDYIFNVPPGSTKSTILSVMSAPWVWTRMPHARFICGSYTHPLSLDLSRKSRSIVESEKYQACFPEVKLHEDQNTKGYFATTKNGMRFAVGAGGSVIGMHAHFILIDDPLDPAGAKSEDEIANVNSWISETLPSRKIDKRISVTMLIMQRLHQNDPTGFLKEKSKSNLFQVCFPSEIIPGNTEVKVLPPECEKYYVDGLLDPVRLNRQVLKEAEEDLGPFGYACQHLQTPIPLGGGQFDVSKVNLGQRPPEKFLRVCRFWDKAGTAKGGAFTVGTKIGMDTDALGLPRYWVLDVKRGQWNSAEREAIIKRTAEDDGKGVVVGIEQEPGSGGLESAEGTARRLAGYRVVIVPASGDKTVRADEFSTQVNAGCVYLAPAAWNAAWLEEFKYFPNGKYMDQVDSGSGAFTLVSKKRRRVGAI